MRESVSAVFKSLDGKIFTIERQSYLSVFPGYTAFPGGKVDKKDLETANEAESPFPEIESTHWVALKREIKEELNFCLDEHIGLIETSYLFGTAITPEFNPYRFKAHFFIIQLKEAFPFNVDSGEAKSSCWEDPKALLKRYKKGEILAVPPVVAMVEKLTLDELPEGEQNLTLPHIEGREVPMIESIYGVKQFLPLSNTFPPANRTNCFIIGDSPLKLLVDPSPKNSEEKEKLKRSIDKVGFDAFFISHHHADHHEFLPDLYKDYQKPVFMSEKTKDLINQKWGEKYLSGMELKFLREGDHLGTTLGKKLKVYEVPGHDEGQLALAPEDQSWFFVGDLIQTVGTVVIGDVEGDMAKYFKSLQKVIDLNPRFIIPSHGISLGGVDKLKMTLKHRLHREEQVKELDEKGMSVEEILGVVYEGL
ncbi:MAG: MBL fold metallo-hydrolase, partial [Halobacteriovoraceae bacterium]|nr:MBL fold metallo-hydrolase [Halobacteriovoraceae bacterium]